MIFARNISSNIRDSEVKYIIKYKYAVSFFNQCIAQMTHFHLTDS